MAHAKIWKIRCFSFLKPFKEALVSISPNTPTADNSALAALHTFTQPLALIDTASKVLWHSAGLSVLMGDQSTSLLNLSLIDSLRSKITTLEGLKHLSAALNTLAKTEFRIGFKTQKEAHSIFVVSVTPINPEALVPTQFCVSFTDVTEVETLRVAGEKNRQLTAVLFDSVNAGMGEWFVQERSMSLGPRLAIMIGDEPSAWIKRPIIDLFDRCHPEDTAFLEMQVAELVTLKLNRIHTEFRVMHKDGFWVALLARGHVVARNDEGEPIAISFVFIDVTELRHEDSRWKHRAQLSSDWFWATDASGNLSEFSNEVASLLNCKREDLLGRSLPEALKFTGVVPLVPIDMSHFVKKRLIKGLVVRVDRPNIPISWFELDATPRYDFRGEFIGHEGVGRNVTKRHLQELELLEAKQVAEHSNKSKSVFLATMSHEIRTPMNGVLGMAEMLSTGQLDEEQAESVTIIRQSATHLLSLIDSILDFSKLEADRVEIEERQVYVDDLVYSLTESLMPVAKAKGVRLRAFCDPSLPPVFADDTRVRQVLNNFVGNAIKFSSSEIDACGEVYIRAESKADGLLSISVTDNGIGIAPKHLSSLFDAFTQAEVSTTRRFGGTGLGLAISKKLIELMGGMINVESEIGNGSTFTLILPLKPAGEASQTHKELHAKHCVLVGNQSVENNDLQYILRNAGATAFLVRDVAAAFNAMESVLRPTVFIHTDVGSLEQDYAKSLQAHQWGTDVSHLMITDGARKSLRMIEENIACADWGRAKGIVNAVCLMTQDRTQIPSSVLAANKRLLGMGLPKTIEKISGAVKVLVAEDDPINQRVISRQLAHLGVKADIAQTGQEALEMWMDDKNYSMILTDLHMPVMDGYELTRRIRSLESANEHIPIVALTANAVTGETFEAYKAGIDLYLTKPILLADLSVAIATFAVDLSLTQAVLLDELPAPNPSVDIDTQDFDLQTVIAILGDDDALIRDLTDQYQQDLVLVMAELDSSFSRLDAKHIKFLAHRLKSSSKSVGALRLGALFANLEEAPSFDSPSLAMLKSKEIHAAIDTFKQALSNCLPEMKGH
jgi:signal transduction histidine kinase/CheY-like chemotaxis protein/HPt (histidine-containing phosphotransfer) domain-containing protein